MKPYSTLKMGNNVVVYQKSQSQLSTVSASDVGKMFKVINIDYSGRAHNKYISSIYLRNNAGREIRACIDELARCNANYEPEGEFLVCVGCGSTFSEIDLIEVSFTSDVKSCPVCGMLAPTIS